MKKDFELMAVQHETSEASLRKRHQEAVNDLTDQLDHSNKQRTKYTSLSLLILHQLYYMISQSGCLVAATSFLGHHHHHHSRIYSAPITKTRTYVHYKSPICAIKDGEMVNKY